MLLAGYQWNNIYQPYDDEYIKQKYRSKDEQGELYRISDLTAPGLRNGASGQSWRGFDPSEKGRHWAIPRTFPGTENMPEDLHDALDYLDSIGRIHWSKRGGMPAFIRYLRDMSGLPAQDVITDISPINSQAKERTGYTLHRNRLRYSGASSKPLRNRET